MNRFSDILKQFFVHFSCSYFLQSPSKLISKIAFFTVYLHNSQFVNFPIDYAENLAKTFYTSGNNFPAASFLQLQVFPTLYSIKFGKRDFVVHYSHQILSNS